MTTFTSVCIAVAAGVASGAGLLLSVMDTGLGCGCAPSVRLGGAVALGAAARQLMLRNGVLFGLLSFEGGKTAKVSACKVLSELSH